MSSGSPKIYTRTGDKGKTSLIGGARVSKSHVRLEAYGTLDELNSFIGLLRHEAEAELGSSAPEGGSLSRIEGLLSEIQVDLFNVGSQLACEDAAMRTKLPTVSEGHIRDLEAAMDEFSAELPALKNFILPGGSRSASLAHVARTVCRRAERACVALSELDGVDAVSAAEAGPSEAGSSKAGSTASGTASTEGTGVDSNVIIYVNRLSDFLFVLARYLNHLLEREETLWKPSKPK